ncbi:MAG: hypothetical protein EBV20_01675 [Betaproteobacteria bacterium]|jgi:hypothetical protein|nr:hypothetical protein [Betaproteobacteria bacterium]NBP44728.1 hypothetical protein [Betaproteobacteria bacterium]
MPHAQSVSNHHRESAGDSMAFRVIFLISFGLLFVLALLARLVGSDWRSLLPGAEGSTSMVQGVKTAVYTLMSQII